MQVAILRLVQAKSDHPDKFTSTEVIAIEKLNTAWLAGKYSSWGALLTWARDAEKGGNLRPHLKSWLRGSGFLAVDEDDEQCGLSSGFHVHDQDGGMVITVAEYSSALDYLASHLTRAEFARHFDSITGVGKGNRYRLRYEKGGVVLSSLRKLLGTDANLKARNALTVLIKAASGIWDRLPNPHCNQEVRQAKIN